METDDSFPHSAMLKRFLTQSSKLSVGIESSNDISNNEQMQFISSGEPEYSKSEFPCDHCASTFISADLLSLHIELEHKCMEIETIQFENKDEPTPSIPYNVAPFSNKPPNKGFYMDFPPLPQSNNLMVNSHGNCFLPPSNTNGHLYRPTNSASMNIISPDTIYYQPLVTADPVSHPVPHIKQEIPFNISEKAQEKNNFSYPFKKSSNEANVLGPATFVKQINKPPTTLNPLPSIPKKSLHAGENLNSYLHRWFLKKKRKIERSLNLPKETEKNQISESFTTETENDENSLNCPIETEKEQNLQKLPTETEDGGNSLNCVTEIDKTQNSQNLSTETETDESSESYKELNIKVESDVEEPWQNKRYSNRASRPVFLYQSEEISQLFNFKNNLAIKRNRIHNRQNILKKYSFIKDCSVVLDRLEDCIAKHDDMISKYNKKLKLGEKCQSYRNVVKNITCHFLSEHKVMVKKPKYLYYPKIKKQICHNNNSVSLSDYESDYSNFESQQIESSLKDYYSPMPTKDSQTTDCNDGDQQVKVSKPPTDICKICSKVFNKDYLRRHMKNVHGKQKQSISCSTVSSLDYESDYSSYSETQQNELPLKEYYVPVIKKESQVSDFSSPEVHQVKASKPATDTCKICSKVFNKEYLRRHLKNIHGIGNFKCLFCDTVSPSIMQFKEHQKLHKNEITVESPNMPVPSASQHDLISMENMVYSAGLLPNITPEQKRNMIRNNPLLYNLLISEPKAERDFSQFGWTVIGEKALHRPLLRQPEAPVNNRPKGYPLPVASRNLSYITNNRKLY